MAQLTDLPYELLLRLLLSSGNVEFVTTCRWTYFCLAREATTTMCYKLVRTQGRWTKAKVVASALEHRFLGPDLLDHIAACGSELVGDKQRGKRKRGSNSRGMELVRIPGRLFQVDLEHELPVMRKIKQQISVKKRRRRRVENPNQRCFDVVRRLLQMGVSVTGARGSTGLVLAAKAGNMAMVRLLLHNGADSTVDGSNRALLMAVVHGHLDVAKRLVKAGAPLSSLALRYAVQKQHMAVVDWLMKKGAEPDMTTIRLLDSM